MKYLSVILAGFSVVMCLVLAYFLSFTELLLERIEGSSRQIMIGVLIIYAIIRSVRMFKQIKAINS